MVINTTIEFIEMYNQSFKEGEGFGF